MDYVSASRSAVAIARLGSGKAVVEEKEAAGKSKRNSTLSAAAELAAF